MKQPENTCIKHEHACANPYTAGIADFVAGLRYEAIPHEVLERIKLLILDSLGCAIFGAGLPWSRILADTLGRIDTTQQCTAWGMPLKLSAPHAALVNGTLVQGFELDDVHSVGVMHVGAVTLPAVLAAAETLPQDARMTGRDFLRACVAGYEVGPRVGMCMGPEHIAQGWHSGATVGVFSAAAGAAAALRLDADQTVNALGIGGTQGLESGNSAQRSQLLDRLMSRAVFAEADGIVRVDPDRR